MSNHLHLSTTLTDHSLIITYPYCVQSCLEIRDPTWCNYRGPHTLSQQLSCHWTLPVLSSGPEVHHSSLVDSCTQLLKVGFALCFFFGTHICLSTVLDDTPGSSECSFYSQISSGAALCCFLVSRINLANYSVLSRFILPRMVDMIVHLRGRVRWRRKSMHLYESPPSLDSPSLELCILVAPWVGLVVL